MLESNLDGAEMFLKNARKIVSSENVELDLPEIKQDLDNLQRDITKEKDRLISKIPLLEKLREVNYNDYIDHAMWQRSNLTYHLCE